REGLRLRRSRNVIIQNLTISGASVAGVYISDEDYARPGEPAQPRSAEGYGDVTIQRVNILKTGPKGQRHAMALMGLENVRVEQCAIVGWGGSGIEIVACRNVHVSQCSVRGLDDFTQNQGIRIRAGSEHVVIDQCRLESPGAFGISIGGTSKPVEFRLVPSTAPASARTIEANDVSIERSIIKGGEISVDIISALNCRLRSNSIINPTACVIRAASLKSAPPSRGELAVEGLHLTSNLFIWEAGRIQRLMDLTNSVDKSMVQVEQNLWWSPETDAEKEHRGNVEGTILFDQVLNVDPRLDDSFHPANSAAELFGTFGP
ncbi:MAG TPA: right-handed parallel beta-helix repeat-containing protein, partial [Phycisphaerales bacterium]|nr:right-handed parallel beta-helix repeat-containing protein [Phycisphaerales bacterium]